MTAAHQSRWTTIALVACIAAPAGAQPSATRPRASGDDSAAMARRVDALFTARIRQDGPGCAVGVYRDGRVVLARGYGIASVESRRPITARTTFDLGSASKPFTALAALLLEQRGRLSLDDDVRRWVPELPDHGTTIRVRDLLQHTSGVRDWGALTTLSGDHHATMQDFVALIAAQRALNFTPGTRHEYSHSDFVLLALAVERASGEPFGRFVEREVLRPLGMTGSVVNDGRAVVPDRAAGHADSAGVSRVRHPSSTVVGGQNLYTSVRDLAGLDRQLDTGIVGGRALVDRMLARPTLANGDTIVYAHGLRLGTRHGLRTIARGGHHEGLRSEFVRYPDQHFAVATLCNSDVLEPWRFTDAIADVYLGAAMRAASPVPPASRDTALTLAPATLARLAGTYRSLDQPDAPYVQLVVRDGALGEVLFHEIHDDTLWRLTPVGARRFAGVGATGNIGYYHFDGGADSTARVRIVYGGDTLERLERVADSLVWRPAGARLAEFAGRWFSPDIDTAWELTVRGDRLVLRRRDGRALTLRAHAPDEFMRGFGWWAQPLMARFRFHRDASGAVTHFTISTPPGEDSVRELRFDRLAPR